MSHLHLPLCAAWGLVAALAAAGLIPPASAQTQAYPFDFPGLRAELGRADAIVDFEEESWVPDSSMGWDPESKTWQRMTLHGRVRSSFRHGPLEPNDTLAVVVWYSRFNREFYELEERTQQFVWGIAPTTHTQSVLLLRHDPSGWVATRGLLPDSAFVAAYAGLAALPRAAAVRGLVRMLITEYVESPRQHWGHIRVIQDDLSRVRAYDPGEADVWQEEVRAHAEHLVRIAGGSDMALFVQLARYLPLRQKRECMRRIVRAYDAALEDLRQLGDVDTHPPEMTRALVLLQIASEGVAMLPEAMEGLLPPERSGHVREDSTALRGPANRHVEEIVARARRFAAP